MLVSPLLDEGSEDVAIPAETITVSPSSTKPACSETTNARLTSKLKPEAEIIGCSPYDNVLRKMQIYWGVRPLKTATEASGFNLDVSLAVNPEIVGQIIALAPRLSAV